MKNFLFSDRYNFLKPLEDNWCEIYDEYTAIESKITPWHEAGLHNGRWSTYGLYQCGERLEGERLCPRTAELVHAVPGLFIAGFSVLKPKCRIKPHVGYTSEVLRSHLGLICPEGAWLQVEDEVHHWTAGQVVVFDDTLRHSAGNDAMTPRVVLIVDFIRPTG